MRLSVIDIGTNTLLLLIADVERDGTIIPLHHGHVIGRLGRGVDEHRTILPETFMKILELLEDFAETSKRYGSNRVIACGTSALRDAGNADEFVEFIKRKLGVEIRILTGNEEAELTYRGAVSEFLEGEKNSFFTVLDIGGGSTELTVGQGMNVLSKHSLDIGCVRLTERFLKTSPPSSLSMSQTLTAIRERVSKIPSVSSNSRLIGVAGTVTTLAALDLNLPEYDPQKVSGHELTYEVIQQTSSKLRIKTVEEMKAYPQILPGRADVLLAGIVILLEVMSHLNIQAITASDRGLRYGIALEEARRIP
ncbi:MAG: Ppx/GppA family phosphatase [Ignavibacteriales bacterium]|nr:Ppx/GppA family phosphatase [Ignavibacteriales bacterium]